MFVKVPKGVIGLLSVPTLAVLMGAGLLIWGLRMVYEPLAYIVPGACLLAIGGLAARATLMSGDE
jgi:ABC-type antimicrobial peptide transport system permease subunit